MNIKALLLCGNTNRAKAYLNSLMHIQGFEISVLLYGSEESIQKEGNYPVLDNNTKSYLEKNKINFTNFNTNIIEIIKETSFNYNVLHEQDVNSEVILKNIDEYNVDYVIFAGYGGQILSPSHFKSSKKYIHCHPGLLPLERGSTTLYYSILQDRNLSVTAFYMTASIDDGEIILRQSYPQPQSLVDIDIYIDNCLRADTLVKSLSNLKNKIPTFKAGIKDKEVEYYVIHPLLKHISLLKLV
ncbi:hypothetical protein LB456_04590 [Psychroflexus sp. CAK57W]|uniref:formyltransferase family protein n=1 Tax=Psychroflexus curvus TaxID=2873595 RepID=UPI001CCD57B1|nr:formyltransferase family protein [Psychroflexus curvus]MBZ9786728.1 hypothetical protein [Psychroflexus curvus]